MTEDKHKVIRHAITQLLSRREHGFYELLQKLAIKGFTQEDVFPVLSQFQQADIQSDARFADMQVRNGISKGHGVSRIREVLKQHRVTSDDITNAFSENSIDWFELALQVKQKKFGEAVATESKQIAKQQRFLQYRGFSFEQINHALTTKGET